MNRKRLREGLSHLFPADHDESLGEDADASLERTLEIDESVNRLADAREIAIDQIRPDPRQPRQTFDEAALEELTASIREQGVLQPILVVSSDEGFEIVAGERRWRAAKKAGKDRIPAIVRDLSERERKVISLMENLQREDLNDIDRARGLADLREVLSAESPDVASHDLDEEAGSRLGISGRAVRNYVALLSLPEEIRSKIASGGLTEKHGRALRRIRDSERQSGMAEIALRLKLSGDETMALTRALLNDPDAEIDQIAWRLKAGETLKPKPVTDRESLPAPDPGEAADRALRRLEEDWRALESLIADDGAFADAPIRERLERLSERMREVIGHLAVERADEEE